jgi:hypothetical protein
MKIRRLVVLGSASLFLLIGCSSPSSRNDSSASRRIAADDGTPYETTCAQSMDKDWPSVLAASTFLRDSPTPPYHETIEIDVKASDGSLQIYSLPNLQGGSAVAIPGMGRFATDNGSPYMEYQTKTQVDWQPKNANSEVAFSFTDDWKKTDRAGVCFGPVGRIVPAQIAYSGNAEADGVKLTTAVLSMKLYGDSQRFSVKGSAPADTSPIATELLIPATGLDVSASVLFIKNGSLLHSATKVFHFDPSAQSAQIGFSSADLGP